MEPKVSEVEENTCYTENDPRFSSAIEDISETVDRVIEAFELTQSEIIYLLVKLTKWQAEKSMFVEDQKV